MKKTLLVTLDFYPAVGGVSYYWMKLAEQFPINNFVVLAPPLPKDHSELSASYRIIRKPFLLQWVNPHWLVLVRSLWSVIRSEKPDIVIVGQILPVGTAVWFLSLFMKLPYIVSCHGMDIMQQKSTRKRWLMKKIFARAHGVIANSHYTGRAVQSYGVPSHIISYVYPCPVRTPHTNSDRHPNGHTLLTVGRLVERKGHEYTIRALSSVIKMFPDVQYVIFGDGPNRHALETLVTELQLNEHVMFLGALSDQEAEQWYEKSDIFIMTPFDKQGDVEGFGIVYLEANAFGLPIIATRSGGVAEAVLDGETGIVVEQKNIEAISDAICRLLSDRPFAHTLGQQGQQRVHREFQWNIQAARLISVIEQYTL